MLAPQMIAIATPTIARSFRRWIFSLGGLGFIPLGLLDSSVIPLPGSMDALTIILSARDETLWPYYALMATIGSLTGAYVTYRLARKGGTQTLERKFPARTLARVQGNFNRWGFGAIAVAALLPPPVPLLPFLFAAGAVKYSVRKFLLALALGRVVRYSLLAFLAAKYGVQALRFLSRNRHPSAIVIALLAAAVAAGVVYIVAANRKK